MTSYAQRPAGSGLKQWWPIAAIAGALIGLATLIAASFLLFTPGPSTDPATATRTSVGVSGAAEDAIANKPWPYPSAGATQPTPIALPTSTQTTSLGVPTGYPKTPEGALAQLAAYLKSFLEANPDVARQINAEWVIPGGPGNPVAERDMAYKQQYGSAITYMFAPSMAQVRGSDLARGFSSVCVLGNLTSTYVATGTTKTTHAATCRRMWWIDGRWQLENKASAEPAPDSAPPPRSTAAYSSGWADIQ